MTNLETYRALILSLEKKDRESIDILKNRAKSTSYGQFCLARYYDSIDDSKCVKLYQKSANSGFLESYYMLGAYYIRKRDFEKAKENLLIYEERIGVSSSLTVSLALVYKELGDTENAEKYERETEELNSLVSSYILKFLEQSESDSDSDSDSDSESEHVKPEEEPGSKRKQPPPKRERKKPKK